jgi:hypothetical protein
VIVVGFDLKKQLKVHDRVLLRQLFSAERDMRMVDWFLTPKSDIGQIAQSWEHLDEDRKRHYQVVLQDVDLLSNINGQKILVEELEAQPVPRIENFSKLTSHADRALWTYLYAPEVFETASMFARAEALRNGKQSNAWNSLPKQPIEITREKVEALEDQIREYYWNKQMRGKVCKVHHYQRQCGSQYFFAYLPDWPDKRLYFDEHEELAPKEDTYAFSNAFVFEPRLGIVELMAKGGLRVQLDLRRAFCKSMLDIEVSDQAPLKRVYQLDQLLDPNFSFVTLPEERISEVHLTRLRMVPKVYVPLLDHIELKFLETENLDQVRAVVGRQLEAIGLESDQIEINQVTIQFVFMGSSGKRPRKMTVNVMCPSSCDLRSKPEELQPIGRSCLVRWGIIDD